MGKEKIFANETEGVETIRQKFSKFNPKKVVTRVKFLKDIRGTNGTVIAKTFQVNYKKRKGGKK